MQSQQNSQSLLERMNITAGLTLFTARIFAIPVQLLIREDVGERAIGFAGGFSILLLLLFPIFFPNSNSEPLLCFLLLYIARCFVHRVMSLWNRWRGVPLQHTRRPGTPLLMRILKNWPLNRVRWLEPPLVMLLGYGIAWLSRPLGVYLILAGIGLSVCLVASHIYLQNEAADMNDAALDSQDKAERFRQVQGR